MAETDVHRQEMQDLIEVLTQWFHARSDVYVSGNLLLYYEEGNPRRAIAPDVFVVVGVPDYQRRIYKLWEEGVPPTVVWKITSASTRREDVQSKRALYERLGVQEYFLFDPLQEYLAPPLQGFRLVGGQYEPLAPDAAGEFHSEALGLRLRVEAGRLRLLDAATGAPLLRPDEVAAAYRAAEAELARLRAEVARLRGVQPNDEE